MGRRQLDLGFQEPWDLPPVNLKDEVQELNELVRAILNSLGQGFLVIERNGICSNAYSPVCEEIFETIPAGKSFIEVLRIPQKEHDQVKTWFEMLFTENIEFKDLIPLGPQRYKSNLLSSIFLNYVPIRGPDRKVSKVILVVTDRTAEEEAQRTIDEKVQHVERIVRLSNHRAQFNNFVRYAKHVLQQAQELDETESILTDADLVALKRKFHTLKGFAGTFFMEQLRSEIHEFEDHFISLSELPDDNYAPLRILIKSSCFRFQELIDNFLNEYSFIVGTAKEFDNRGIEIDRSRVYSFAQKLKGDPEKHLEFLKSVVAQPAQSIFEGFQAFIEATALQLEKKVGPLRIIGGDNLILVEPYEELLATFVHIFGNAIDHGIEAPSARERAGKNREATISVRIEDWLENDKKFWRFTFEDDGRGIDTAKLRQKLILMDSDRFTSMDDNGINQQILFAGISTVDRVSQLSGRGVGLNAVRDTVLALGGSIGVDSILGQFCRILVQVPQIWELPENRSGRNQSK